ncbi:Intron-encoded nuclease repeat 2 [Fragilaria crotonensis]|nr:Intron-encoded nuclease repeat 2 [Fragilaria crotonensis]
MARPRRAAAEKAKKKDDEDDVGGSDWEQSDSLDDDEDDDDHLDEDEPGASASRHGDHDSNNMMEVDGDVKQVNNDSQKADLKIASDGTASKKRKKKSIEHYDTDTSDEGHLLPTELRKTNKGGYAHTKRSRARISKANTGNTPWNKGRQRSEADKAKIAAAVRARNQAILTEKLKLFNMTEEEFRAKQKEIKYLRERVRRAKQNSKKLAEQLDASTLSLQVKLDEAIALRDQVVNTKTKPFDKKAAKAKGKHKTVTGVEIKVKEEEGQEAMDEGGQEQPESPCVMEEEDSDGLVKEAKLEDGVILNNDEVPNQKQHDEADDSKKGNHKNRMPKRIKPPAPYRFPIVAWSMEWTPHEFDNVPPSCPNGGPSGLICCRRAPLHIHDSCHKQSKIWRRDVWNRSPAKWMNYLATSKKRECNFLLPRKPHGKWLHHHRPLQ